MYLLDQINLVKTFTNIEYKNCFNQITVICMIVIDYASFL